MAVARCNGKAMVTSVPKPSETGRGSAAAINDAQKIRSPTGGISVTVDHCHSRTAVAVAVTVHTYDWTRPMPLLHHHRGTGGGMQEGEPVWTPLLLNRSRSSCSCYHLHDAPAVWNSAANTVANVASLSFMRTSFRNLEASL